MYCHILRRRPFTVIITNITHTCMFRAKMWRRYEDMIFFFLFSFCRSNYLNRNNPARLIDNMLCATVGYCSLVKITFFIWVTFGHMQKDTHLTVLIFGRNKLDSGMFCSAALSKLSCFLLFFLGLFCAGIIHHHLLPSSLIPPWFYLRL